MRSRHTKAVDSLSIYMLLVYPLVRRCSRFICLSSGNAVPRVSADVKMGEIANLGLTHQTVKASPTETPHRRASTFLDMSSSSSNVHTASRLSFTLGRAGLLRFISPAPAFLIFGV